MILTRYQSLVTGRRHSVTVFQAPLPKQPPQLHVTMVDKAMTVKRENLGATFGRIGADTLVEVERCLAVFLGIAH